LSGVGHQSDAIGEKVAEEIHSYRKQEPDDQPVPAADEFSAPKQYSA
jgi:hypothetical protein